jgi:hypothetical protein
VHGCIAQCNGIPINWAKVAEPTTKKKAHMGEMSKGWLTIVKKERLSDSGDAMNPSEEGLRSYL